MDSKESSAESESHKERRNAISRVSIELELDAHRVLSGGVERLLFLWPSGFEILKRDS